MRRPLVKNKAKTSSTYTLEKSSSSISFKPERCVQYYGVVNYATNEKVLKEISEKAVSPHPDLLCLLINSPGGPSGTAMSFFDTLRYVLKIDLVTVASGDVDSSGIILFLAGETRYVTPHTTLLFHLAGRTFDSHQRYTALEIEAIAREDKLKDLQYASVVAERSHGRLSVEKVINMMERNTLCTPDELVAYGLADAVIS